MSDTMLWVAVIGAALTGLGQKWLGYQVPPAALEHRVVARITNLLPVALLGVSWLPRPSRAARTSCSIPASPPWRCARCCSGGARRSSWW